MLSKDDRPIEHCMRGSSVDIVLLCMRTLVYSTNCDGIGLPVLMMSYEYIEIRQPCHKGLKHIRKFYVFGKTNDLLHCSILFYFIFFIFGISHPLNART